MGFNTNGFGPGAESLVLVIKTNASEFAPGTVTVVDSSGGSATVAGLAPVPEPNLFWPGGAFLALAVYRRVRVSKV